MEDYKIVDKKSSKKSSFYMYLFENAKVLVYNTK